MKEIPLTQGMVALVDDEDYERLVQFRWYYKKNPQSNTGYAARSERKQEYRQGRKRRLIFMHRAILNTPLGYETDHINGNGLDNRRENLRIATRGQNEWNISKRKNNTSGYKGVTWIARRMKWQAQIAFNGKHINLGYFKDKLEAAKAHNEAAIKYHGEFVCLH